MLNNCYLGIDQLILYCGYLDIRQTLNNRYPDPV